ncbi:MAG TPA: ethanolamine ammonia-lyase subunit EutC [Gemmataceae bacterium]|nr:ethanolamine ammonia-lyase subunit EutC [Gemmataceae bacterium]
MAPHPPSERETPLVREARARTPARILVGRAGGSYRTATLLALRRDHAAARDAVQAEIDLQRDLGGDFVERFSLFEAATFADSQRTYLMRPDLGRRLTPESRRAVAENCPAGADLQVAIADGLSAAAVVRQVPELLPALLAEAGRRGWSVGRTFFVRRGRVGVLNDIGDILDPAVVVLLIGERPGLATADSLSAYMAYRPRPGDTDARRNLISNIHARGVPADQAVPRILALAEAMRRLRQSGVSLKESLPAGAALPAVPPPALLDPPGGP